MLGRQRAKAQRLPADNLGDALKTLAEEKRHALIEVELTGGALGRLLIQAGRLVSAHLGDGNADVRGALAKLRQNAGSARLQMLSLTDEQIALACAALAGTPVALGKEVGASFDSAAFVTQLGQQYFTGVVALEQGLQTYIRRFQYGTALSTERLPAKLRATRFTQIVWQEQLLPEVGASRATSPQTHVAKPPGQTRPATPPVVQAAVPASASHPAPVPIPTPTPALAPAPDLVADQPFTAPPQSAQAQGALKGLSSEVPGSFTETVFVQAVPAAPTLSTQPDLAQAAPAQAVQVQAISALQRVEPAQATLPATAQPSAAAISSAASAAADAEAWERLRAILDQNLGKRSPRVYQLMRTELGAFSGLELMSRLAWQVERIAGATAARSFKNGR